MNYAQNKNPVFHPSPRFVRGEPHLTAPVNCSAILATPDRTLAQRLARELEISLPGQTNTMASSFTVLRELLTTSAPGAIFLDTDLLAGQPILESVHELASAAPVLVLAPLNSQSDIARLLAGDRVDFIARVGDFVPLAVALLTRRLKQPRLASLSWDFSGPPMPPDMGEIFRHEINNPLTGILGNAELVLAHPEHFSGLEVQRLRTIVDLAVRLRESIRRISNAWEHPPSRENPA